MNPIRCLVVDDERLARVVLGQLIAPIPELQRVGEAGDMSSAREMVRVLRPELVFLDIGLPDGSGFDLLGSAGEEPPEVVFVTAHDQHAVRAFDFEALDYLVKPVDPGRFAQTIRRAMRRLRPGLGADERDPGGLVARQRSEGRAEPKSIFIQAGATGCFVAPDDMVLVRSDRNYSTVHFADGRTLLVRQPLTKWIPRLPAPDFVQLDRTVIVNLARVSKADVRAHAATLHWNGKVQPLEVGRSAAGRLRQILRGN